LDPGRLSDLLFFFLENYLATVHFWNQKNDSYEIEGYWISKEWNSNFEKHSGSYWISKHFISNFDKFPGRLSDLLFGATAVRFLAYSNRFDVNLA